MAWQAENNCSRCPTPVEAQDAADSLLCLSYLFKHRHKQALKLIKDININLKVKQQNFGN
jgi:hypothetical protein